MLNIYCDDFDFSRLGKAFEGEAESDCGLAAEIVFAGGEEIKRLNAEMRSVDAVTDVLSFPSLDGVRGKILKKEDYPTEIDEEGNLFLGSIAICTQRAREQAEEYGHSYERELFYLAAHGLFHLLGYDHMTEADKREMRLREERVMEKLGLARE
ncbi:MAG: rRNA maturation RNase YbeY [Clostridia bacterium]|nr:rRNA maturation RNase YbeY [Clostridia bacterium]